MEGVQGWFGPSLGLRGVEIVLGDQLSFAP